METGGAWLQPQRSVVSPLHPPAIRKMSSLSVMLECTCEIRTLKKFCIDASAVCLFQDMDVTLSAKERACRMDHAKRKSAIILAKTARGIGSHQRVPVEIPSAFVPAKMPVILSSSTQTCEVLVCRRAIVHGSAATGQRLHACWAACMQRSSAHQT